MLTAHYLGALFLLWNIADGMFELLLLYNFIISFSFFYSLDVFSLFQTIQN